MTLARTIQTTVTCDHAGCGESFTFPGLAVKATAEARKAGWAASPARGRFLCPAHRSKAPKGEPLKRTTRRRATRLESSQDRANRILQARGAGKTLQEISETLDLTPERVRQIIADTGDAGREANAAAKWARRRWKGFNANHVRRWLLESGWKYCAYGKHVVCLETYGKCRQCSRCNTARAKARYRRLHPVKKKAKKIPAPAKPKRVRPSRATGYRTDPDRHKSSRAKVSPERRQEIARLGAAARQRHRKEE